MPATVGAQRALRQVCLEEKSVLRGLCVQAHVCSLYGRKGEAMMDKYCGPCGGMVNGNGCGRADCPVRPAPADKPAPVQAAGKKKGKRT